MERRHFVGLTGISAFQFFVQACGAQRLREDAVLLPAAMHGFGPVLQKPGALVELPKGFAYVVLQRGQDPMSDGHKMPDQPDGMACFEDEKGNYILLRNHEQDDIAFLEKYNLRKGQFHQGRFPKPHYRKGAYGGVTRLVFDPERLQGEFEKGGTDHSKSVVSSNFVLAGTRLNCSGGVIDGGWVTCEESSTKDHGYAFMTRPDDAKLTEARRIRSWGRLHREGVVLDPETGIVYMTEDRPDGCFYRFVPNDPKRPMGKGRLQALSIPGLKSTSPYPAPYFDERGRWVQGVEGPKWPNGTTWDVEWVDVPDPQAEKETCRAQSLKLGATSFQRGEGIAWDGQQAWFAASLGGECAGGQIFRYRSDGKQHRLTLELEVEDRGVLSAPDNMVVAPFGDLILAEDNYEMAPGVTNQWLRGLTRDGRIYDLARNPTSYPEEKDAGAEFTGLCFSPCGRFLFLNIQRPINATVAISGPWPKVL